MTYFGWLLMKLAKGSILEFGQYVDHSSYILRPNRIVSCSATVSPISSMMSLKTSSRTNLFGASTTPSREMKRNDVSFLMNTIGPHLCQAMHRRPSPQRRRYGGSHNLRLEQKRHLVWRFRSPHHSCSESEIRTSESKPHGINKLLVSL